MGLSRFARVACVLFGLVAPRDGVVADPTIPDSATPDTAAADPVLIVDPARSEVSAVFDTVLVPGKRGDAWRAETPFVTVVRPSEVSAADDAPRLLERTPSLRVSRTGGLGSYGTASLRGSPASHVPVFWDGVPLLTASDAATDLSLLPLTAFQRIEVFRTGAPAHLPGVGAAGAIHVVSGDGPRIAAPESHATVRAGSEGTRTASASTRFPLAGCEALLAAGVLETDGDFDYLNRNGTFENRTDDVWTKRRNNDVHESDTMMLLRKRELDVPLLLAPVDVLVSMQTVDRDKGVPGTENLQTTAVRNDYRRTLELVRMRTQLAPRLQMTASASQQRIVDRFFNTEGEVVLSKAAWEHVTRQTSTEGTLVLWTLGDRQTTVVSGEHRTEHLEPTDLLHGTDGYARRRRQGSLTIEDRWRVLDERLLVSAAYQWLRSVDNYTGPPPPIFQTPHAFDPTKQALRGPLAGARLAIASGVAIKGNLGWLGRLPTFLELFGENGVQDGNAALTPEKGWQEDAGIAWDGATGRLPLSAGVTVFQKRLDDMIVLVQNSQRTTKAVNLDRARIRGLELELTAAPAPLSGAFRLGGSIAATFLDAMNTGPSEPYHGKRLPYQPPTRLHAGLTLGSGRAEIGYRVAYESATYRDRYNSDDHETPDRTLHDVRAAWAALEGRLTLSVEATNVTNRRTQDLEGYPLPGRSWFWSTDWHF